MFVACQPGIGTLQAAGDRLQGHMPGFRVIVLLALLSHSKLCCGGPGLQANTLLLGALLRLLQPFLEMRLLSLRSLQLAVLLQQPATRVCSVASAAGAEAQAPKLCSCGESGGGGQQS